MSSNKQNKIANNRALHDEEASANTLSRSLRKPLLVEPQQNFDNGDFSSSHYNKVTTDPRSYRNVSNSLRDDSKVISIKGGFDNSIGTLKPIAINNTNSFQKESMLSQSLRNTNNALMSKISPNPNSYTTSFGIDSNTNDKLSSSFKTAKSNSVASSNQHNLFSLNPSSAGVKSPRPSNMAVDAENPDPATVDIISRHLVAGDLEANSPGNQEVNLYNNHSSTENETDTASSVIGGDEFDSLQLQGGDITREIYNWKRDHSRAPRRTKSFNTISRTGSFSSFQANGGTSNLPSLSIGAPNDGNYHTFAEPDLNISEILLPGGFRRSFIAQKQARLGKLDGNQKPTFFTRNFIEFLSLYGHFAGEELSDEEDEDEEDFDEAVDDREALFTEEDRLLPDSRGTKKFRNPGQESTVSTFKAVLLLLKAFIGTGILFLPKGFYNGGIIFSVVTMVFFSVLSYWCFLLLIDTRIKSGVDSFGDLGKKYYGSGMRLSILTSIVLAQIGFASAYIVFVAQNLRSVLVALFGKDISISFLIFSQLVIFIPLSLTRKISKLSGTALIADFFILLGIIYIYYNCAFEIVRNNVKHVEFFNPNEWTVFIGTAVFTYEGICLLIPIQKSMKQPSKFSSSLGGVMVGITVVFISIGSICYMAYGDDVQTVILNNFPQENKSVNFIQLLYALAILLSTPLQLFPAIRILEHGIFGANKSGKYNLKIKWKKNLFRTALIIVTSLISWVGNSDLDKFVALIGSFACVPLIYVYPPILHIKSYVEEISTGNAFSEDRNYWLNNHIACYANVIVTIFGVVLMIYTSVDSLKAWIQ
ncbi:Avt3 protein [Saccharomycopsis crataegensis]|uniref:Avt3 protein n=1 Tax=Saccharomycopsis crataegensis TaxID=43959 RepID=A0AAV5QE48_9ASCO|nr:Avt3 protein [Saccharomycopsis crataegensis]